MFALEQFRDEWSTEKYSFVCMSDDKSVQKTLVLFYESRLWS
jgi:hypothetical protein